MLVIFWKSGDILKDGREAGLGDFASKLQTNRSATNTHAAPILVASIANKMSFT